MTTYKTFKSSPTNWAQWGKERTFTVDKGLPFNEARRRCAAFNNARTPSQIRKGVVMKFTAE